MPGKDKIERAGSGSEHQPGTLAVCLVKSVAMVRAHPLPCLLGEGLAPSWLWHRLRFSVAIIRT